MKFKFIFCLTFVLSGGWSGCTTVKPTQSETVLYSKPSSESLQKIKIERISLTNEQLAKLASLQKEKTEFGSRWLVEEKPDTMQNAPWDTKLYIFDSKETNQCVRIELLDHAGYDIKHVWLNEKMLFVRVPWGHIAWTDFVLDTETCHFAYIEDGIYVQAIESEQERESRKQ